MFQIPSPSIFFPGTLPQDIHRDHPKWMLRTFIYQIGQFQHYFSHLLLTCALLPQAASQYPSRCTHCRPWQSSSTVCVLVPAGKELHESRSCTAGLMTAAKGQTHPWSGWRGIAKVASFQVLAPVHVQKCVTATATGQTAMAMEIDAVFGEQNVPMCLSWDPLCHNLTPWLSLDNQGCKKCICVLPPLSKDVASPAQREGIYEMPTLSNAIHLEQYEAWTSSTL